MIIDNNKKKDYLRNKKEHCIVISKQIDKFFNQ